MKFSISQQGVALVTALLVVALVTIVAVAMTTRQQLDIHRTANIINGEQAYVYALGGESWVKSILWRDSRDSTVDSLHELWASPLPPLPISGGTLKGNIEDLQSRFNLNNLVQNGQVSLEDVRFFQRLLRVLELPATLVDVVVDWLDSDMEARGAEDEVYLAKTPAYRASNFLFSSPSEIRLLAGVDRDIFHKLLPYVSTLPVPTPINVNTAPLPVLMALADGLSENDALMLIAARNEKPFQSLQDFFVQDALAGLILNNSSISVSSAFFMMTVQVEIDRSRVLLSSVLQRKSNQVSVIMRSL